MCVCDSLKTLSYDLPYFTLHCKVYQFRLSFLQISCGFFSVPWRLTMDHWDTNFEIYAAPWLFSFAGSCKIRKTVCPHRRTYPLTYTLNAGIVGTLIWRVGESGKGFKDKRRQSITTVLFIGFIILITWAEWSIEYANSTPSLVNLPKTPGFAYPKYGSVHITAYFPFARLLFRIYKSMWHSVYPSNFDGR